MKQKIEDFSTGQQSRSASDTTFEVFRVILSRVCGSCSDGSKIQQMISKRTKIWLAGKTNPCDLLAGDE